MKFLACSWDLYYYIFNGGRMFKSPITIIKALHSSREYNAHFHPGQEGLAE